VSNAAGSGDRLLFEQAGQFRNPAGSFSDGDSVGIGHGNAGAVIAPVFQAVQPFKKKIADISATDVAYDSAHRTERLMNWGKTDPGRSTLAGF
jgi:hypothetical protein